MQPGGNYTPGQGPEGVLFMYDTANPNHQDLIHFDVEPYAPLTQDTMSLNAGFTLTGATTTGAYVGSTTGGTEGCSTKWAFGYRYQQMDTNSSDIQRSRVYLYLVRKWYSS
ncbi:MAG: hypothetical protein WDM71_07220 [Ferruginibacter sp.]